MLDGHLSANTFLLKSALTRKADLARTLARHRDAAGPDAPAVRAAPETIVIDPDDDDPSDAEEEVKDECSGCSGCSGSGLGSGSSGSSRVGLPSGFASRGGRCALKVCGPLAGHRQQRGNARVVMTCIIRPSCGGILLQPGDGGIARNQLSLQRCDFIAQVGFGAGLPLHPGLTGFDPLIQPGDLRGQTFLHGQQGIGLGLTLIQLGLKFIGAALPQRRDFSLQGVSAGNRAIALCLQRAVCQRHRGQPRLLHRQRFADAADIVLGDVGSADKAQQAVALPAASRQHALGGAALHAHLDHLHILRGRCDPQSQPQRHQGRGGKHDEGRRAAGAIGSGQTLKNAHALKFLCSKTSPAYRKWAHKAHNL